MTPVEEVPGAEEEVVFSFEVYGAEVRRIRKDISVGDLVRFQGRHRSCGRILDATAYEILERWVEVAGGRAFNAFKDGMDVDAVGGDAARLADPSSPVRSGAAFCKFWMSNGTCRRVECQCEHPEGEELRIARGQYWDAQKRKRAESANPEDPHSVDDKRSHAQRACVFAEWLCETYGVEELRRSGVVDVAGGRGELAFELAAKRRIPCTVVDPRCPGRPDGGCDSQDQAGIEAPSSWTGFRLSRAQRLWLEANVPGVKGFAACQAYVESCPLWQCRATVPCGTNGGLADTTVAIALRERWSRVVGECHLVVGLHPDQATGAVVELAGEFNKPFAVVPCCTFADDFPERKLANGSSVRTYDDLVAWLRAQSSGTKAGYLGFQGKNLVVFVAPASPGKAVDAVRDGLGGTAHDPRADGPVQ